MKVIRVKAITSKAGNLPFGYLISFSCPDYKSKEILKTELEIPGEFGFKMNEVVLIAVAAWF